MSEIDQIKKVDRWQTSDGEEHFTLSSAQYHARKMDEAADANAALDSGKSVAEALRAAKWPGVIPPILERVTKETALVVSHWQCRATPGYKVRYLRADGYFHVWGNAGCWSGSYGGKVSVSDVARYASDAATAGLTPAAQT